MIPKLIHQTAKTNQIPENLQGYINTLKRLHPNWQYRLWTDEDNLAFVQSEFPDFVDVWTGMPKNIMRADVIRYLLMYKLGGFYCDTDYEMLKPFDLNDEPIVLPWETAGEWGPDRTYLCNCVFASSPGHPFWKLAIDDLKANPPRSADMNVIDATGPAFLTRVYRQAQRQGIPLKTWTREYFSAVYPKKNREYQAFLKTTKAYGIHHCEGSWREYTAAQRAWFSVKGVIRKMVKG